MTPDTEHRPSGWLPPARAEFGPFAARVLGTSRGERVGGKSPHLTLLRASISRNGADEVLHPVGRARGVEKPGAFRRV